jgi:mRNA interferase RelE/StbE
MKAIIYTPVARRALRQHANRADLILSKIEQYAVDPAAQSNNVKKLRGRVDYRLRVGDFRIVFSETADTITIHDIGPRGGIYD